MAIVRRDSWAAGLTEEQSWALFYKSLRADWQVAARWAMKEFGLERMPSRSAFYEWRGGMAENEHRHAMEQGILAQTFAKESAATNNLKDGEAAKALEQKAVELAVITGDVKTAKNLYALVLAIRDREMSAAELEIKRRAQAVKESELKMMERKLKMAEEKEKSAAGTLADKRLSPEEKMQKMKEIFG